MGSTSTQKLQKTTKANTTTNQFFHQIHTEFIKDNQSTHHNQPVPTQNPHRINKQQQKHTSKPTSSFTKTTQNQQKNNQSKHQNQQALSPKPHRTNKRQPKQTQQPTSFYTK